MTTPEKKPVLWDTSLLKPFILHTATNGKIPKLGPNAYNILRGMKLALEIGNDEGIKNFKEVLAHQKERIFSTIRTLGVEEKYRPDHLTLNMVFNKLLALEDLGGLPGFIATLDEPRQDQAVALKTGPDRSLGSTSRGGRPTKRKPSRPDTKKPGGGNKKAHM